MLKIWKSCRCADIQKTIISTRAPVGANKSKMFLLGPGGSYKMCNFDFLCISPTSPRRVSIIQFWLSRLANCQIAGSLSREVRTSGWDRQYPPLDHSTVEVAYLTKLDTLPHPMVYTIQARRQLAKRPQLPYWQWLQYINTLICWQHIGHSTVKVKKQNNIGLHSLSRRWKTFSQKFESRDV